MIIMKLSVRIRTGLLIGGIILSSVVNAAQVTRHNDTVSGLEGWLVQGEHIEIQLNPLKPDQVRAFYLGRGFSDEIAEIIVQSCVYQTVIKNVSPENNIKAVSIDLSDWRLNDQRGESALISKPDWRKQWTALDASRAAMNAFEWATYPWQQKFELTGDSGWGMILFGSIEGETFDVTLRWQVDDQPVEQRVEQLNCPSQ